VRDEAAFQTIVAIAQNALADPAASASPESATA
jgi:hypothetical protein